MKAPSSFLVFASILCAASFVRAEPNPLIEGATPEKLLGGAENSKILNGAKEVVVYRIAPDEGPKRTEVVKVDGYLCVAKPQPVSDPDLQHLRAAFSDTANFGQELTCDFDPAIIIRFRSDLGTLDLIACFGCHEMMLYRDGKIVRRDLKSAQSLNTFRKDVRVVLTAIAKTGFPQASELQSLK
jgi:hypothetical protein